MRTQPTALVSEAYDSLYAGYRQAAETLEVEFRALADDEAILGSKAASVFVLSWMREHFLFQKRFDALFGRNVMPASSDQFTAVVALGLEKYLAAASQAGAVRSEMTLEKKRGSLRPDISVWANAARAVAVIECKTNLGYNRTGWKRQYEERTGRAKQTHPGCLSFLCVLTKNNWTSTWTEFEESELVRNRWFCLTDMWPSDLGEDVRSHILHPIEPLFIQVRRCLEGRMSEQAVANE